MYLHGTGVDQDEVKGLEYLSKAVNLGNKYANLILGRLAIWGTVPGYSMQDALGMLHRSAEAGNNDAWLQIGYAYAGAFGGVVNHPRSFHAFKQAAEGGDREALRLVGMSYLSGLGVKKDEAVGLAKIKQAAMLGNGEAMYNMALAKKMGINGNKDTKRVGILSG